MKDGDKMLNIKIAELRKQKNISQEELADVLNTSRQAISKWERGESYPDIDRLKDLARIFDVSIDYLLGYDMESVSVNSFLDKIKDLKENKQYEVTLDEIKTIVSKNNNNCELLIGVVDYLLSLWQSRHNDEVLDLVVDYCKRLLVVFRENNSKGITVNDVHKVILYCYIFNEEYEKAKEYIKNNKIYDIGMMEADLELGLDNNDKVMEILSDNFIKSVSLILEGNIIQSRLLVRINKIEEAYDSIKWGIDFIRSIRTREDAFLEILFLLYCFKASCEKYLKIDYSNSIAFLKEHKDQSLSSEEKSELLRFYNDKKVTYFIASKNIIEAIKEEIKLLKNSSIYDDLIFIYKEIYGDYNE